MRLFFALVLILGIGLAGFAVYMAQDRFKQYQTALELQRQKLAKSVPLTKVVVAAKPLRYGQRLAPGDVRVIDWPAHAVPEAAFTDPEVFFGTDPTKLRTVLRTIEKDEPVLGMKVTDPGEDAGVASRLSAGMRAFTIRVDVASGVSGFLRPGDHVDVFWTGRSQGSEITQLVLDRVRIIAIDQIADNDRNNPLVARTVTVEASPERVALLAQAQSTGRLALSLRGIEDDAPVASAVSANQRLLLGIPDEVAVEPEPEEKERVCTVRQRQGGEVVTIRIPCTN